MLLLLLLRIDFAAAVSPVVVVVVVAGCLEQRHVSLAVPVLGFTLLARGLVVVVLLDNDDGSTKYRKGEKMFVSFIISIIRSIRSKRWQELVTIFEVFS